MKNFFRGTSYLFVFIATGIIFQISCSNSDGQVSSINTVVATQLGKIIYARQDTGSPIIQLWTCNYDGSNQTHIPIALPANFQININNQKATPRISPDGQSVFFVALNTVTNIYSICSCNISGTNFQQIYTPTSFAELQIGNAY